MTVWKKLLHKIGNPTPTREVESEIIHGIYFKYACLLRKTTYFSLITTQFLCVSVLFKLCNAHRNNIWHFSPDNGGQKAKLKNIKSQDIILLNDVGTLCRRRSQRNELHCVLSFATHATLHASRNSAFTNRKYERNEKS